MIQYTALNIFVREVVNGAMALSALLVCFVFARYAWHNRTSLRHNSTVKAAVAILILMAGHFMRAGSSWVEFMLLDLGIDTKHWLQWTWLWFILAFIGIVSGKILILGAFAPRKWRNRLILIGMPLCAVVPLLIAIALR